MKEFGSDITTDDIVDTLAFFDSWDERYKYIIDLGKELPPLPDSEHIDKNIIRGCQSKVWLASEQRDGRLYFQVDSDAFIVKGLLGVVLAAYNTKTAQQVLDFDIEAYFAELDLMRHLSPTRGSGLQAMVARIRNIAAAAVSI